MLEKKIIKIIEIFTLGFIFPISVVYFSLSNYILIFLWIIFLYTFIIFIKLYKEALSDYRLQRNRAIERARKAEQENEKLRKQNEGLSI